MAKLHRSCPVLVSRRSPVASRTCRRSQDARRQSRSSTVRPSVDAGARESVAGRAAVLRGRAVRTDFDNTRLPSPATTRRNGNTSATATSNDARSHLPSTTARRKLGDGSWRIFGLRQHSAAVGRPARYVCVLIAA